MDLKKKKKLFCFHVENFRHDNQVSICDLASDSNPRNIVVDDSVNFLRPCLG
ncbi:hypothetical protein ES332_A04G157900v1 [Gossypium tomentosum]|uniref:Uncharacterized protein n=1 Tax=Gossypium tomentosum TaxID=34277 RepID=A0A5D2R1X0_GOSTO|nr:hypothetical protein ES332_A04G157900v1 [Gossypium tomentosum]